VSEREFRAQTEGGELVGWLREGPTDAPPALLLHGGPGLSDYLESLAVELDGVVTTARYQQRGIAPSVTSGERRVERHVADVVDVLDALGWEKALIVGHSWGGHLVLHFAVAHPNRMLAAVPIDPLGGVGDGGMAEFVEALRSHVPPADLPRYEELEALEQATDAERSESLRMVWPFYYADPSKAPPFPDFKFDQRSEETWASISAHLEAKTLEKALPAFPNPFVIVHGEKSPIPIAAAEETVALVPNGRLVAVSNSGHWPWLEQPGSVRAAMEELISS
jgi:pimeloyl-ACP methyl ester carboxylesterase